jgi:ClpP class serine protease
MPADDNSLPPLTLARRALAIRDEAYHGFMEAQRTTIRHPAEARALADSVKQAKSRKLAAPASANVKTPAGVQVIPICGTITPFGSIFSLLFGSGMGGLMGFRESFAEAMGSPDVGAIVLEVDSPGGYVDLVPPRRATVRRSSPS